VVMLARRDQQRRPLRRPGRVRPIAARRRGARGECCAWVFAAVSSTSPAGWYS